MKTVCIIGHFGFGETLLNGQTVKTKVLANAAAGALGEEELLFLDTHGGKKALLKLPLLCFDRMRRCRNIVIMPAQNGLRIITPLLTVYNLFFRRQLHYVVIGGWLDSFLKNRGLLTWMLKQFHGIYVETGGMKAALEAMGFANVYVMPNCKDLVPLKKQELVLPEAEPYRLCTFSRVMKEKGIEEAVEAVKAVNARLGHSVYTLDIYGQVEPSQKAWFEQLVDSFPEEITYAGSVPFAESVGTLKKYFALLFPTYYQGEGFAGTLIDAFFAGVPVVASRWKYNEEIVTEGLVGTFVPPRDAEALAQRLLEIQTAPESWNAMKENCLLRAAEYAPETVSRVLLDRLQ